LNVKLEAGLIFVCDGLIWVYGALNVRV
jgi:hypothetical protein